MTGRRTGGACWPGVLVVLAGLWMGPVAATPSIEYWETGNGARVYFVPTEALPMVDIRVVFDAGAARDGDNGGLAAFTNSLLGEGTADLDGSEVARRFEGVGARFDLDVARDMAIVALRSLSDPKLLDPAAATFAEVLNAPAFPQADLERERERMLVALERESQSPADLAEKAFYQAVYGDHPYASPVLGTPDSARRLTRGQVESFYRRYYVGRNATVAIVGDVTRAQAELLARQVVGGLPPGEPAPNLPPVPPARKNEPVSVRYPSAQTHLRLGQPGMSRVDPDYFPLYVGNHILGGGGFSSRLMQEVRDARGLAYSVSSYFIPMRVKGPLVLSMETRNDQAAESLQVMHEVLRQFVEQGPTADELESAKRNITGGFPLRIDSNSNIVDYLALIGFYGLPLDYLDTFIARVEAVTAERVRDAFRRRVNLDGLVGVSVGGAAGPQAGG